jgi:hypothetical protein
MTTQPPCGISGTRICIPAPTSSLPGTVKVFFKSQSIEFSAAGAVLQAESGQTVVAVTVPGRPEMKDYDMIEFGVQIAHDAATYSFRWMDHVYYCSVQILKSSGCQHWDGPNANAAWDRFSRLKEESQNDIVVALAVTENIGGLEVIACQQVPFPSCAHNDVGDNIMIIAIRRGLHSVARFVASRYPSLLHIKGFAGCTAKMCLDRLPPDDSIRLDIRAWLGVDGSLSDLRTNSLPGLKANSLSDLKTNSMAQPTIA